MDDVVAQDETIGDGSTSHDTKARQCADPIVPGNSKRMAATSQRPVKIRNHWPTPIVSNN